MRRFITLTIGIMGLLLLASCSNGTNTNGGNVNQLNDTATPSVTQESEATTSSQQATNQPHLEELSATITAAGQFWEDWWGLRGLFAWEHFDDTPWEYWIEQPNHPRSIGMQRALPTFMFESIRDVTNHLSQFYTDEWVDREFFGERTDVPAESMMFGEPWAFAEYDGQLYVHTGRIGTMRPNWATAAHTLIEYDRGHAFVETTVSAYDHMGMGVEMPTATFRFVFIDGRIESGFGQWGEWPDTLAFHDTHVIHDPHATHDPTEFYGLDPIAELDGTWINAFEHTIDFPMPNTTVEHITRMPNGAFVINIVWDGGGDSRFWLFPAGVEMIRYNFHWERMPYNPYVVSDTSKWRLFNGDFEVTACCDDEAINLTLFFRQ